MSEKVKRNITCPKCGNVKETTLLCSVNASSFNEAHKQIFDDTFFEWTCEKCGETRQLLHPLLYNDIKNRTMIYYIPNVDRRQLVDDRLEAEFPELADVKKRVVPTSNALKEKLYIFDLGLKDMAVELTKLAVAELVTKSQKINVSEGYLSSYDEEANSIGFEFFVGEAGKPFLQSTRLEVYKRSLEIVETYFKDEDNRQGFLTIDRRWAKEALGQYRKLKK